MRTIGVIVLQLVISFSVTALVLPAVLFRLPSTRASAFGPAVGLGLMAVIFLMLRLIWPRQHRTKS
jgi:hypothetical protein